MKLDKDTMRKLALLIAFAIVLTTCLQNSSVVARALQYVLHLLMPFLVGGCMAFILNVPMCFFECVLFSPPARVERSKMLQKLRRPTALVVTLLAIVGIIAVVILMIIPTFYQSFSLISNEVEEFGKKFPALLDQAAALLPLLKEEMGSVKEIFLATDWASIGMAVVRFFQNGNFVSNTVSFAGSLVNVVTNLMIGLVFAIYILLQKETLSKQLRHVLYAFLPERQVDRMVRLARLTAQTFRSFLTGQCLEAFLLGLMFFISMAILKMPHPLVISVLISVTALIPIFGAVIGCVIGALLILFVSPTKMLWFIVLFLVLQQVEGNVIYPRVVGNSVGLPSIWVLLAVTLGVSLAGVLGLLFAIPLMSVLYTVTREKVRKRLYQKQIAAQKLE